MIPSSAWCSGAEPLGLLRFSNIALDSLLHGLMAEFEGLSRREDLELTLSDGERREYVLHQRRYALALHTFQYEDEIDATELMTKQIKQLNLLKRKFIRDLRGGDKIFVCKRSEALCEQDMLPLHAVLNRFAVNTLLFVTPADATHPPGAVERLLPGLLRGNIDRFASSNEAVDLSLEIWLEICVKSYLLIMSERLR